MNGLAALLGSGVVVQEGPCRDVDDELFPEERSYLANAVPKRRAEFGTARVFARRALAHFGVAPCALVPAKNRAPIWPAGMVGSITHSADYCAVAVARATDVRSLGIDAEVISAADPGIARLVLTPREQAWARSDLSRLVLIFSAKEAYFKCQFPITNLQLGFHDVELEVSFDAGTFRVKNQTGRFAFEANRVFTAIELSP